MPLDLLRGRPGASCASCARPSIRPVSAIPGRSSRSRKACARGRHRLPPASARREGPRPALLARARDDSACPPALARRASRHRRTRARAHGRRLRALRPRRPHARGRGRSRLARRKWPRFCCAAAEAGTPVRPVGRRHEDGHRRAAAAARRSSSGSSGWTVSSSTSPAISRPPSRRASPLSALQGELGKRGQWLSLDPAHAERATLGGVLASNAAGPRRHLYGIVPRPAHRRHRGHGGRRHSSRGGGKVVKNVAGYDLPKLFIGSLRHARRHRGGDGEAPPAPGRRPARGRALRPAQGGGRRRRAR